MICYRFEQRQEPVPGAERSRVHRVRFSDQDWAIPGQPEPGGAERGHSRPHRRGQRREGGQISRHHNSLPAGLRRQLSFAQQMANTGGAVGRAKGNADYSWRACERALELMDLTLACGRG